MNSCNDKEDAMRVGAVVVVIWLIIGAIAAGQRGYFSDSKTSCAKTSDTIVTIIAGPLNYVGINPKVSCVTPQPSK
jgi:hypothetical protein